MSTENIETTGNIRLTQYSHGGGCGCKISPKVLEEILQSSTLFPADKNLLVGNSSNDDAAAYDLGNGQALISTTDFFMPIVDDAFDFGRIASANAISDVYAMGGRPLLAIAILGWPVDKLPASLAQQVLNGAREICAEAGISLAGGHSIDTAEPMFGLAVTGLAQIHELKQNNTAKENDLLFLTKPIGVGILATAQKRGMITEEHATKMISQLATLNKLGEKLGKFKSVTAMTDVTGFGVLGHLIEMAEGSGLSAELYYERIPVIDGAREYLSQRIVPDATYRNWNSYSSKVSFEKGVNVMEAFNLLPDPQTNGGLLFSVAETGVAEVINILRDHGLENFIEPIGKFCRKSEKGHHSKAWVMNFSAADWVGTIGVTLLLIAFGLNLLNRLSQKDLSYILLNCIGAALACTASVMIKYWPFIILEAVWTIVSLTALLNYSKKHQ